MDKLELIEKLQAEIESLTYGEDAQLDAIRRKTEMIVRNLFGEKSKYLADLSKISFWPMIYPASDQSLQSSWQSGKQEMTNLVNTMKEEILLFDTSSDRTGVKAAQRSNNEVNNKVFIVHGHDESMKQTVARTVEKLGLDPIILHEKPNVGRTIIEKFTEYADVNFAIVLLSPDDIAYSKSLSSDHAKYRARQNVILELGYFIGKLGRERVVALFDQSEDFEMPSDYSGVLFVPYEISGRWQFDLVRELKACKYKVDANKLLE